MNSLSLETTKVVIKSQIKALQILLKTVTEEVESAAQLIQKSKGRVIVEGIGKSEHIGRKIAATLTSMRTPAFFLHSAVITTTSAVAVGSLIVQPVNAQYVPYVKFLGNPSSRLFFDQNGARINLQICADNLPGNAIYYRMDRGPVGSYPAKTWEEIITADKVTSRCYTIYDLDGPGSTFAGVTYITKVALNGFAFDAGYPISNWPTPCYSATSGYGLCDSARR